VSIIDWYIIKKFLGTYVFAIFLIIAITVVIDLNAKIDNFIKTSPSTHAIVFDYYLNFIPYFVNTFSPLFIFIAVIFFTSQMADNSEVIAILSSGISFGRLVRAYLISATIIALFNFVLSSYVIPPGNVKRIEFENKYVKNKKEDWGQHIQLAVEPGIIAYFDRFDNSSRTGRGFSLERFEDKRLVSKLTAKIITWDSLYQWTIKDYMIRDFGELRETITTGERMDTTLSIIPSDFLISVNDAKQLTTPRLKTYIDRQKKRGIGNIQLFEIEYYQRFSNAFAAFILTIIGASLSSRKIKGGMGLNIGIGIGLIFSYILFMQISSSFAISDLVSPLIAVWIPNIIYAFIAAFLYTKAPR
jgi:lipopolysaccharide export system permease protein